MKLCPTILGLIAIFSSYGTTQPTWPSAIDELEDVMFLNTGYRSRGFSSHVTPCSFSEFGPGRQTAAEWLRIAFHDMATTNIYNPPHGGIDASLAFELNSGENIGVGFSSTLTTYAGLYNSQLSVADLIALGVYASVRACGGPIIAMRGGRVDATSAGPIGVPQPSNAQGIFVNQFARMGFSTTEMIQMTACGHTMGGVHAGDFSNIVAPGTVPNDYQLFDTTTNFDNNIAVRYINGPDTDPLAVGISASSGRNSDVAVFTADRNVTLQAMTNAAMFNSMCSLILQKMIEVVDPAIVTLSDIIQPYEVKPAGLQLTLLSGRVSINFSGDVRIRTTVRGASQIASVQLLYKDRTRASGGAITALASGTAAGFDDNFSFYGFNANIPTASSISSFIVLITLASGTTQTYNNNGAGFPVSDSVIVQTPQSCLSNGKLTVVAAVRNTVTTPVNMAVTQKVAQTAANPVPALSNTILVMTRGATIGPYVLYSGSSTISSAVGAKYGVTSGNFADNFKDPASLGTVCAVLSTSSSSTSPSVAITGTSSTPSTKLETITTKPSTTLDSSSTNTIVTSTLSRTSSASPIPTLSHKQTVGASSFQGCYTEGNGVRALSGASYYNYGAMTVEICATNCAGYTYWGVEYGGECYCGNSLASTSRLAALSDCSFVCPGNSYEYCGAGNRLEMYKSVSTPPPTIAIKERIGDYAYYGCRTEGKNGRSLSSRATYNYASMNLEMCASSCQGYKYWGVEYGGECYCGNAFGDGSMNTTDAECSFVCPGDKLEWCGAGNRLSVYYLSK